MQSDQQHFLQVGHGNIAYPPVGSFFDQNVDLQPSKICPRNYIIFDTTANRSQIMYHPAMAPNVGYPGAAYIDTNKITQNDKNAPKEAHALMKEDSADIDLLLGLEEEEYEEEEELSTARTMHGSDASDTADSCSLKPRKTKLGLSPFSHKSSSSGERKREKIRKTVKSLRGIVPGGNQMNTIAVIDEAVKYLKSLKVELQRVDAWNLKN